MTDRGERLEQVLIRFFEALDQGEAVDVADLCDGDADLEASARSVLGSEPGWLRGLDRAAEQEPELLSGSEVPFGDFRRIREIGRGGMGTVHLAEQISLRRVVALKVLHRSAIVDRTARLRFEREALLTASLEHPHIVPVHAVGEVDGQPFLAMQFLRGPSFAELGRDVPTDLLVAWFRDIASALDAAHRAGVVHRDVKPGNILLDSDHAYLVDFGLARGLNDQTLTRAEAIPGTLSYLAPELLGRRSGAQLWSPASDIYALGASMYEVLAGRPLFDAAEPERMVAQILESDPEPLRLGARHRALSLVISKCLRKSPSSRYATASEVVDELSRVLADEAVLARPESLTERLRRRIRRHPRTTGIGAVTCVLLLLLSGAWLQDRAEVQRQQRERLRVARDSFADGRFAEVLDQLVGLGPTHAGEIDRLRSESRRALALDALLERCLQREGAFRGPDNEQQVARAIELGLPDWRPRETAAVLAFAAIHREAWSDAAEWVGRFESVAGSRVTRTSAAIRNLLGEDVEMPRVVDPAASFGELLCCSIAMRWSGLSLEEMQPELDRLIELRPSDWRTGVVLVSAVLSDGRAQEAYRLAAAFAGIAEGRPQWTRLRALIALRSGRPDDALRILGSDDAVTGAGAYVELKALMELARRDGDFRTFDVRLAELRDLLPGSAEVRRAALESDLLRTPDRSVALLGLGELARTAPDRLNRELAAVTSFEWNDALTPDQAIVRHEVLCNGLVRDRELRARVDVRLAQILGQDGQHDRARELLRPWRRFRPVAALVARVWLDQVVPDLLAVGHPTRLSEARKRHFRSALGRAELIEAREVTGFVLDRWRDEGLPDGDPVKAVLLRSHFLLSVALGELGAAREVAGWALQRLQRSDLREALESYAVQLGIR